MTHIISLLLLFVCPTVQIMTPPMHKTDTSIVAMLYIKDGTPPFTYRWSNGGTNDTAHFANMPQTIICRVRDSKGCVVDSELTIVE